MKLARCSESASLDCSEPVLLVWPTTFMQTRAAGAFLGDLAQPHRVGAAHLGVGPELGAARVEQELHAELVVGDAEGDDAAEGLLGLGRAAELDARQVDAVQDAQLLAGRRRQGAAVPAERLDVALLVVERGRFVDQRRRGDALEVERVAALPGGVAEVRA